MRESALQLTHELAAGVDAARRRPAGPERLRGRQGARRAAGPRRAHLEPGASRSRTGASGRAAHSDSSRRNSSRARRSSRSSTSGMRAARITLAAAGLVLGVVAYRVQIDNLGALTTTARATAIVAVAWAFLDRRADRLGAAPGEPARTADGGGGHRRSCSASSATARIRSIFTVFFALGEVRYALVRTLGPRVSVGHVTGRAERALVQVGYAARCSSSRSRSSSSTTAASRFVSWIRAAREPPAGLGERRARSRSCRRPSSSSSGGSWPALFIALIVRRLVRATPRARRHAGAASPRSCGVRAARRLRRHLHIRRAARRRSSTTTSSGGRSWASSPSRSRYSPACCGRGSPRADVGELVLELERTPPHDLGGALARALGDPTLEVAFWLPERQEYVDVQGTPSTLPEHGAARTVTRLEHEGEPVAAIVHDPTLVDEPELFGPRAQPPGSRSRMRASTPRCAPSWRRCRSRGSASSRLPTKSAAGSSATSTTGLSSGSSRSRSSFGSRSVSSERVGPRDRLAARRGGRRAPGGRGGAARARPWRPSGDPHGGRARRCPRVAGRQDAASRRPRRRGGPAAAADRGDCVLRRLRGAREHRQARPRLEGGGQRAPPRTACSSSQVEDDGVGGAHPAGGSGLAGSPTGSRRSAAGSWSRARPGAARASWGRSRARRDRGGLRAHAGGPRAGAGRGRH